MWTTRTLEADDAARACGVSRNHLRVILHRIGPMIDLVSTKTGRHRFFSRQDIATLALARILERFGVTWLFAVADAMTVLERPPDADAVMILRLGRSMPRPVRDTPSLPVDEPTLVIPIGRIVQSIMEA